ncbi:DUF2147 domain-containing protein [Erythrobacter litoralis]|uniref:DUF2147 domain-containing protein n=1 Tax=Erythrobacter litoralis (strain HTCC2594) TaxID=314225 RepID=Q2N788_ERYLH|nr:DUF2147 domain-containing protein [Erythrobacter litoralis]ABC64453.1 hypothetical protein ELI_11805 [Erythrobacter litoralis HTCC2594]
MKRLLAAAAILACTATPALAADPISGRWVTEEGDAVVTIGKCGASYCGKLSKYLETPPNGVNQKDVNNPNPRLRSRKLLGTPLLTNLTVDDDLWRGDIYDPRNGKTYRSVVRRKSASVLEVKGCIGPFCQTQNWRRAR